ncbi:DUF461 domain-containing protein [Streptomyces sp. NPDC050619]|uniref:DUF461 domain-containing protein n=1 Tax=Streptomyces sp. NPDC050619 TaxID=3157214 RepID=UPI0034438FBF
MSSSLRRGALSAAVIAFSIASLAACGAGNNAQTLEVKPDNAATSVGAIKLRNVVIITQPDAGTKGPAVISATVFNTGRTDQTLDAVSVAGGGNAKITPARGKGRLTVPAGGSVILGGKNNAAAAVPNLGATVQDGNAQKVTFTFSTTGDVSLRAFVVPADSFYSQWGPSEAPAAPGASATTSEKPGEGTATGSESPSDTPADATTPTDAASASANESANTAGTGTDTGTGTAH